MAVLDSHVTTLIAGMILYYFGTGPIKGFGITLSIGVIASLFTAVAMTRWILQLVAGSNLVQRPKALREIGGKKNELKRKHAVSLYQTA